MRTLLLGLSIVCSLVAASAGVAISLNDIGATQFGFHGSQILAIGVARPPRLDKPQILAIGVARPPRLA